MNLIENNLIYVYINIYVNKLCNYTNIMQLGIFILDCFFVYFRTLVEIYFEIYM